MGYEESTCDLHVTSSGGEVYRINLEEGRFMEVRRKEETEVTDLEERTSHN